jgi:hypothetical protein
MISKIELGWANRVVDGSQTPRRFLDFVIDGNSLYEKVDDFITPLGWLRIQDTQQAVDRLLRKQPSDFSSNRNSIYICPECADLGCGAVTVVIERNADLIVWRDFAFQNNYDETILRDGFQDLGPFYFDTRGYYTEIKKALLKEDR